MDLTSRQNIQFLFKKRRLRPLKRLGQNFLIDGALPKQIAAAGQITAQDVVLEIGPGIGAITQELASRAKRVIAVEKDREMVEILKETLGGFKNVEVVQQDIRFLKSAIKNYKLVGNLPFYLTAPVIRQFLESGGNRPNLMVLVVQKEVAQRICAQPPKMSILANSVQFYAEPEIVSFVSKKSFWPEPEVDAAIIKIIPSVKLGLTEKSDLFFKLMKTGFAHPRKQLANNLSHGLKMNRGEVENWLKKNGIRPEQRAETLAVEDWINLTKSFVV